MMVDQVGLLLDVQKLTKERDHARQLLRDFPCPRPANSDPDDTTIGACMDLGHCGCEYGVACGYVATTMPQELMAQTGCDPKRDM